MYIKHIYISTIILFSFGNLHSLDIKIRVDPFATIPIDSNIYSVGGGVTANIDLTFIDTLSIGPEFGFFITPYNNTDTYPQIVTGGLGTNLFIYPVSRLSLEVGGAGGVYTLTYNKTSLSNLWWKVYGTIGIRLSPSFSLSANAGYINLNGYSSPLYTGIIAGVSLGVSIDTKGSKGNIDLKLDQTDPIFPLFYSLYKDNSIGTLTITNNETAEIRNVKVSFKAGNYTGSVYHCGDVNIIRKNRSADIPLYANFTDTVLNFTEDGRLPGEVVISYDILGKTKTIEKATVVETYNRNTFNWSDTASLASFISPTSPDVLDYSKFIVGVARTNLRTGLNRNMQFAMYLYDGLQSAGIKYSDDKLTPYIDFHKDAELLDYIQYPFQTISFHLGDYDDLGLLYSATLESVGIKSAIVTLEDDFLVAFSLDISQKQASSLFNGVDNLLIINDEVWIPLAFSVLKEGFINSWATAMTKLNTAFTNNVNIEFIVVQEAWQTYTPAGIGGENSKIDKPLEEDLISAVNTDLLRYITTEFGPKIKAAQNDIRKKGTSTARNNKLGQLFVRAGLYQEAKAEFITAASHGSFAALINLGNIYFIDRNFLEAKKWFKRAVNKRPDNSTAIKALDRVNAELEL